jgi:hypothetical protein
LIRVEVRSDQTVGPATDAISERPEEASVTIASEDHQPVAGAVRITSKDQRQFIESIRVEVTGRHGHGPALKVYFPVDGSVALLPAQQDAELSRAGARKGNGQVRPGVAVEASNCRGPHESARVDWQAPRQAASTVSEEKRSALTTDHQEIEQFVPIDIASENTRRTPAADESLRKGPVEKGERGWAEDAMGERAIPVPHRRVGEDGPPPRGPITGPGFADANPT